MSLFDPAPEQQSRPSAGREVDFGPGVLVAAVAVLVLLLAAVLPWSAAGATGWQVVLGASGGSGLPRLFGGFAVLFGVLASAVALLTRRWVAVFVAAAGCSVASVTGLWAVWSQNTVPGNGPGLGLGLALAAMVVLAFRWATFALSRS